MTYLKRSSRPQKDKFAIVIAIVGLIVVFSVSYFFPSFYPTIFFPVASVFWKSESAVVGFFSDMGSMVQSKYGLIKENQTLSAELAAESRSLLILDALKSENAGLKEAFNRIGKDNYVLGTIMVRPPVSPYDTLVLDVGSNSGISVGDMVYADGDTLIGDISDVFAGESKVSLFSTPGRMTSVLVGTSTIAAQATGKGGGNFIFKLPAQTPLSVGAIITIPQLKKYVFGVVDRIEVDSTDSMQTVLFESPVNMSEISFVEVDTISTITSKTNALKK